MFSSINPGVTGSTSPPSSIIDNVADFFAVRLISTGVAITAVEVFGFAQGSPDGMDILLCGSDGSGDPDPTVDLGGGSPTLVAVTSGGWGASAAVQLVTFTNSYTPSDGDIVWCVFKPNATTYDGSNRWFMYLRSTVLNSAVNQLYGVYLSTDTGSSWSDLPGLANIQWHTTASVIIRTPTLFSTNANSHQIGYNNTDTFDELGNVTIPTVGLDWSMVGFTYWFRPANAAADFNFVIYTGTSETVWTKQQTITIDMGVDMPADVSANGLTAGFWLLTTPISVSDGEQIRLTRRSTSSTDLRYLEIDFGTSARRQACPFYSEPETYMCQRDGDTGNFTDDLTKVYMTLTPLINPVAPAGGGGGGVKLAGSGGGLVG